MNYIALYNFLFNWFNEESIINTISNFQENEIDVNKNTAFPLINFYINKINVNQANVLNVSFYIVGLNRVINGRSQSKLINQTNQPEVVGLMEVVALRFLNYMRERNNAENILVENISEIEYLQNENRNGLSGLKFTVDFMMPNLQKDY